MPQGYHHLTYEQRCQIYALKQSGLSQSAMARQLGVDRRSIGRELKRN
jgi:IS30 family transposase